MNTAMAADDVLGELRAVVAGRVFAPGTVGYDRARTVSYGIDRRPAAIVRARSATDVSRVVRLARERGLELAVRSGGHSPAGHGTTDGGIVLDLAGLKSLDIDARRRTAWAGAGLTAGEYTAATAAHGLATGFGDTGSVGLGGITLSGGIGYLVRAHGLTIDNLLAADVVTADGELRHVDARTHPDLFWAIRGGGGNVGVATRFRYRLSEVDVVTGGTLVLPATPQTLVRYVAEALAAPEQLTTVVTVMPVGPHGPLVMRAVLVHAGEPAAGGRIPRRRGTFRRPPGLPGVDRGAARGGEAALRPDEPLPAQPERAPGAGQGIGVQGHDHRERCEGRMRAALAPAEAILRQSQRIGLTCAAEHIQRARRTASGFAQCASSSPGEASRMFSVSGAICVTHTSTPRSASIISSSLPDASSTSATRPKGSTGHGRVSSRISSPSGISRRSASANSELRTKRSPTASTRVMTPPRVGC